VYATSKQQYFSVSGELKYFRVVFTSDGWQNKGIDTLIGKANTVLPAPYRSVISNGDFQPPQMC